MREVAVLLYQKKKASVSSFSSIPLPMCRFYTVQVSPVAVIHIDQENVKKITFAVQESPLTFVVKERYRKTSSVK